MPRPPGPAYNIPVPDRLLNVMTDQPQTGDQLGARLGVNRVTVNTLARKLLDDGVPVTTTRQGYALAPGTPAATLVHPGGVIGRALRYQGTVQSTQDALRAWADDPAGPAPHGATLVAERQLSGRGRRGRVWSSSGGTLVFSVLLQSAPDGHPLTLPELGLMPLTAGVALHEAASAGRGGVCGLKWPNDLLTPDGRKLAGILLEADLRGEEARRAVLGIGVNLGEAPEGAAHLNEFRPDLTRAAFLEAALDALDRWLAQPREAVLDAWKAASLTLGRDVQVHTARGLLSGRAEDLDAQGNLLLRARDGDLHTISAGDVQLVGRL